jgi:hypothetical protein
VPASSTSNRAEIDVHREGLAVDRGVGEAAVDRGEPGRDPRLLEPVVDHAAALGRGEALLGRDVHHAEVAVEAEHQRVGEDVAADHAADLPAGVVERADAHHPEVLLADGQRADLDAQHLRHRQRPRLVALVDELAADRGVEVELLGERLVEVRHRRVRVDHEQVGPLVVDLDRHHQRAALERADQRRGPAVTAREAGRGADRAAGEEAEGDQGERAHGSFLARARATP